MPLKVKFKDTSFQICIKEPPPPPPKCEPPNLGELGLLLEH